MWSLSFLDCCIPSKQQQQHQSMAHATGINLLSTVRSPLVTVHSYDEFAQIMSDVESQLADTRSISINALLTAMNFDVVDSRTAINPSLPMDNKSSLQPIDTQSRTQIGDGAIAGASVNGNRKRLLETLPFHETIDCIEPRERSAGSISSRYIHPKLAFQHIQRSSTNSNSSLGESNATDHSDSWWTYSDDEENGSLNMSSLVLSSTIESPYDYVGCHQDSSTKTANEESFRVPTTPKTTKKEKRKESSPESPNNTVSVLKVKSPRRATIPSSTQQIGTKSNSKCIRHKNDSPLLSTSVSLPMLQLQQPVLSEKPHKKWQQNQKLFSTGTTKSVSKSMIGSNVNARPVCPAPSPCHRKSFSIAGSDVAEIAVVVSATGHRSKPTSTNPEQPSRKNRLLVDTDSCSSCSTFTPTKRRQDARLQSFDEVVTTGVGTWTIRVIDDGMIQMPQMDRVFNRRTNDGMTSFGQNDNDDRRDCSATDCTTNNYKKQQREICFEMKKKNRKNSSILLYGLEIVQACQDLIENASDKDEIFFQVWTPVYIVEDCRSLTRIDHTHRNRGQSGYTMIELGRKKIILSLNEILESYNDKLRQVEIEYQRNENRKQSKRDASTRDRLVNTYYSDIDARYDYPNTELVIRPTTRTQSPIIESNRIERNDNGLSSWVTHLQSAKSLLLIAPSLLAPKAQSFINNTMMWRSNNNNNSSSNISAMIKSRESAGKKNTSRTRKSKYHRKSSVVPLSVIASNAVVDYSPSHYSSSGSMTNDNNLNGYSSSSLTHHRSLSSTIPTKIKKSQDPITTISQLQQSRRSTSVR